MVRLVRLQRRQRAGVERPGGSAFAVTHIAAAAATSVWALAEWLQRGKATVLGAASGAVAGLVAITPASGFVGPMPAMVIGGVAGVLCYYRGDRSSSRSATTTALDVVGVHGVGGIVGRAGDRLVCLDAREPAADGRRRPASSATRASSVIQAIGVVVTVAYSFVVTFILLKIVDATMGLRG